MSRSPKSSSLDTIRILDEQESLRKSYERYYSKLRRALSGMERCRRALIRLQKRLDREGR